MIYKCFYKRKGEDIFFSVETGKNKDLEQAPEKNEYFDEGTVICKFAIEAHSVDRAWNEAKSLLFILWKVQL